MDITLLPESASRRVRRVIRIAAVVVPLFFTTYSALIITGAIAPSPAYIGTNGNVLICVVWIAISLGQSFMTSFSRVNLMLWFIAYHLIASCYLLFVAGYSSPIIYTWGVLIAVSLLFFGVKGMTFSLLLLTSLGIADVVISGYNIDTITSDSIAFVITLIIASLMAASLRSTIVDQRDVDDSKAQASLQHDRLTTLVNNLADAIISTDNQGRVMVYNAAVLSLLDTNAQIEDRNIDDIIQLTDTENKPVQLSAALKDVTAVTVRDDIQTNISGEALRLEITYSPIRRNYANEDALELGGYIIILRDITTSKSLEEERDEFISVVSHELRTPITIAEGTISNVQLMMDRPDIAPENLRSAVDMAHDQLLFLARMVNDLSTLSRAERGVADNTEDIDITELINDLFKEYASEAEEQGLAFNLHMPAKVGTVTTSRLYLKELLQNFISNSLKYTHEGSVTIEARRTKDDHIVIAVKDTGLGISNADQKKIFDKFYRAEDYRTRETSGTGLGLYVAVKLARKIGTEINMKSRLNHGSTFSITLNANKSDKH